MRVTVHKNIICKSSSFFKQACTDDSKESIEEPIKIQRWDESEFLTYIHWLYTGNLDVPGERWPAKNSPKLPGRRSSSAGKLFQCYRFGDFIGDKEFCNLLTDRLLDYWKTSKNVLNEKRAPTPEALTGICANSGMNRLLVHLFPASGESKSRCPRYALSLRKCFSMTTCEQSMLYLASLVLLYDQCIAFQR